MLGDQIRELREARCWSQTHLAEAAALNVRTVQRIEAGDCCSFETMMSLAAALDIDVAVLDQGNCRTSPATGPFRLRVAAACVTPLLLFLVVNLLRSSLHVGAPYDAFAMLGEKVMSFRTFNLVSPVVFIGGGLSALAISTSGFVSVRRKVAGSTISITAVGFTPNWAAVTLFLVSSCSLALLLGYAALEQLLTMVR
jgi:transcriptional regulator with XRE-family HTH domain